MNAHLNAGRKARADKQFDIAEKEGAAAVKEAEALGPLQPALYSALVELGNTYYVQRKYAEAEPFYFRATEIAESSGIDQRTLSYQLDSLGMTRHFEGKDLAALPALERALSLREKALGPDNENVVPLLADLAAVQSALLKRDQAEASLRRALTLQDKMIGPDRARTAATMIQLAGVLDAEAKYEEAERYYRDSLKNREALFGSENGAVSDSLLALAEFLRLRGRNPEAEPLYRRSMHIREKLYGPDSLAVATGANGLSLTLRNMKKFDEAEILLLHAIDIAEKSEGADGLRVTRFLGNLSVLYRRENRLPAAEKVRPGRYPSGKNASGRRIRTSSTSSKILRMFTIRKNDIPMPNRFTGARWRFSRKITVRIIPMLPANVPVWEEISPAKSDSRGGHALRSGAGDRRKTQRAGQFENRSSDTSYRANLPSGKYVCGGRGAVRARHSHRSVEPRRETPVGHRVE